MRFGCQVKQGLKIQTQIAPSLCKLQKREFAMRMQRVRSVGMREYVRMRMCAGV